MARTARELNTDIDRIDAMLNAAYDGAGNAYTRETLQQTKARMQIELERLTQEARAQQLASIDAAATELTALENEANVSTELKEDIQKSQLLLARRREEV
jgi:hypothetical protein